MLDESPRTRQVHRIATLRLVGVATLLAGIGFAWYFWPEISPVPTRRMLLALPLFVVVALIFLWLSYVTIELDEVGVTAKSPGIRSKSLPWSRVRRIEDVNGRLTLRGEPGDPVVHVYPIMDDFDAIREWILRHCPNALGKLVGVADEHQELQLPLVVPRGTGLMRNLEAPPLLGVALFGFLMAGLGFWLRSLPFYVSVISLAVAVAATGVWVVIQLLRGWTTLVIDCDRVELRSYLRKREFRFDDLADVQLATKETDYEGILRVRNDSVISLVDRETGEPFFLTDFQYPNGVTHAFKVVKSLFDLHRERSPARLNVSFSKRE